MKRSKLTLIKITRTERKKNCTRKFALYLCECGKEKEIDYYQARRNWVISCGCARRTNHFKKPKTVASMRVMINYYKNNARIRNIEYSLSEEEFKFLTSSNCYYCNLPPSIVNKRHIKDYNEAYLHNGIDRLNNNYGYIYNNCVACCEQCNKAKLKHSKEDFLKWIENVYNYSVKDKTK